MLIKILTPSFFARQEPKKPMYVALASMILNGILAWVLGFYLGYGHIGLALASSLAAFFTVLALLMLLKAENVYRPSAGWLLFWCRILLALLVLIGCLAYFNQDVSYLREISGVGKAAYLVKMVTMGILVYLVVLRLTGMKIKDFLS